MGEVRFMISEAAKQVKVEAHVLRYWEEELDLTIGRTEMGHRYYTKDDIQLFRCIKKLKDEGMLLKDLKPLIPELKATRLKLQAPQTPDESPAQKEAASAQTLSSTAGSTADNSPRSAAKEKGKAVHENKKAALQPVAGASVSQVPSSERHVEPAEVIPVTQLEQVRSLIGNVLTEVVTDNNEIFRLSIQQ